MKNEINEYHLHKDDYSKLHFEIKEIQPHLLKNSEHVYKAHRHSYYQFIWFKTAGQHYVDYELIEHPANVLIMLDKHQIHYFCKHSKNDGFLYHLDEIFLHKGNDQFRRRIQFNLFTDRRRPFLHLDTPMIDLLESFTKRIQTEISGRSRNYREIIFSLMQTLVLKIDREKFTQLQTYGSNVNDMDLAIKFKTLVEDNLQNVKSIDEFSAELGISSRKLTKISKNLLFSPPGKFINDRKILEAKRLLSNTGTSIKEVAFELGYEQATYFTKVFKKATGMTPRAFMDRLPD